MSMNIGITQEDRNAVAKGLAHLLADSYTLYLKTHNFHWNITGIHFNQLHAMFEVHYTELATAVDEIAERIRALGAKAPGSYTEFAELATVKECTDSPDWKGMVEQLRDDHETISRVCTELFDVVDKAGDQPTADLLTVRMDVHQKTAWMLRSLLES